MNMKKITKEDIEQLERDIAEMQVIIRENKIHKSARDAVPGLTAYPALNNNNDPYRAYKYGVMLSSAPDKAAVTHKGSLGGDFLTISFSDEDDKMLDAAAKQMGISRKLVGSSKRSIESPDTHKISPVAAVKRNKYGI